MFRKWERSLIVYLLILFHGFLWTGLRAQPDSALLEQAFDILEERGELVFEFFPENTFIVKEINSFLSVDRKTDRGFEAYANESGFRSFLEYDIPFRLIQLEPLKKSSGVSLDFPGDWDVYPTHQQYEDFMKDMAGKYPQICRFDTIGQSAEGRNILILKITDNPGIREPEPAFVYSSTMHGDEVTGYVILLHLIDYLCENYGNDPLVTRLVDSIEIWINPLANPDGTYLNGDDTIKQPKRFNSNNIDLNRDYPGILDTPGSMYPESQPENLAQMDFLRSIYMVSGANIHGGKELVNYPFDIWKTRHADDNWYIQTSREYAREAHRQSGPVLYMLDLDSGITNGYDWYEAIGTRQDWNNYFNYAREVTIEISLNKEPPPSELPYFWHYNFKSLLRYMELCLFGIHGIVKDAETGLPLRAAIHILNHDSLHSHIYTDSLTGYFARLIEPGMWDLEISAAGYEPVPFKGVQSLYDQTTWLDVELRAQATGINSQKKAEANLLPFLYGTNLTIPVTLPGEHSIYIYDLKGSLVHLNKISYPSKGNYVYSLEGTKLEKGVYILKLISPEDILTQKIFKSQ
ncbi:M14 family zinc carboxypeptidase [Bacteroidota bacterium]